MRFQYKLYAHFSLTGNNNPYLKVSFLKLIILKGQISNIFSLISFLRQFFIPLSLLKLEKSNKKN